MIKKNVATDFDLPVIAMRGTIVLPNNDIRLEVAREESVKSLNVADVTDGYILLVNQKDVDKDSVSTENFPEHGIVGKILMKVKMPNGNYKVKIKGIVRAKIEKYVTDESFRAIGVTNPMIVDDGPELAAKIRLLVSDLLDPEMTVAKNQQETIKKIRSTNEPDLICDIIAQDLKTSDSSKEKYVNTSDASVIADYLLEDIKSEKEIVELERKIAQEVQKSVDENQKEYYLREKMKAIQGELGVKASQKNDIDEMRENLEELGLSEESKEKIADEITRYETLAPSSSESGILRTYLDWVFKLPWKSIKENEIDIISAEKTLEEDHYGLEKVKERIIEYISVLQMSKKSPQTILCLVGPPGVGKTSIVKSVAKSLNREFVKASLGGVKDESEIRGHRRTYLGALPGRIIQGMKKAKVSNPVFLLDEIDKLSSDYKGDPASALLEVLDPEQNKLFSDHYIEEPFDLSNVMFIATANYIQNIPEPLRDRMEIVELSSYTEMEKKEIAIRHLIPKQLELHGLTNKQLDFDSEVITDIIQKYTREAGVRSLERKIGQVCRKTTKAILTKKYENVEVNSENIIDFLDKPRFRKETIASDDEVGVVNGLAYTQYGGDTLPVEVTFYNGKGKLLLTGKLGEVMQESAQTAFSYVRANAEKYGINPDILNKNDIHIHAPEGAVPKDGPSAGVTMVVGLVSALSNKKVRKDIGMTGEITLRGNVLPIGGLKEKTIAAYNYGIKDVFIPFKNKRDIDDVPKSVREKINFIPVSKVDEILDVAFVK